MKCVKGLPEKIPPNHPLIEFQDDIKLVSKNVVAVFIFDFNIAAGKTISVRWHALQRFYQRYHKELYSPAVTLITMKDMLDDAHLARTEDKRKYFYQSDRYEFVIDKRGGTYSVVTVYSIYN